MVTQLIIFCPQGRVQLQTGPNQYHLPKGKDLSITDLHTYTQKKLRIEVEAQLKHTQKIHNLHVEAITLVMLLIQSRQDMMLK